MYTFDESEFQSGFTLRLYTVNYNYTSSFTIENGKQKTYSSNCGPHLDDNTKINKDI